MQKIPLSPFSLLFFLPPPRCRLTLLHCLALTLAHIPFTLLRCSPSHASPSMPTPISSLSSPKWGATRVQEERGRIWRKMKSELRLSETRKTKKKRRQLSEVGEENEDDEDILVVLSFLICQRRGK